MSAADAFGLAVDDAPLAGDHHPVGPMRAAQRERRDRVLGAREARLVEREEREVRLHAGHDRADVVASEAITVSGQTIMLPGIGSYIATAIQERNLVAIGYAVLVMLVVIILYDQLLFRPLLAWSQKFKDDLGDDALGSLVAPRFSGDEIFLGGAADELTKLANLKAQGVITDAEFADQKAKLLA